MARGVWRQISSQTSFELCPPHLNWRGVDPELSLNPAPFPPIPSGSRDGQQPHEELARRPDGRGEEGCGPRRMALAGELPCRKHKKYPPDVVFFVSLARPDPRDAITRRNCPTDTSAGCRGTPSPSSHSPPATRSTRPTTTTTTRRRRSHPAGPAVRTKIKTRATRMDAANGRLKPATGDPRAPPRIGAKPTAWGSRSSLVNGASGAGR